MLAQKEHELLMNLPVGFTARPATMSDLEIVVNLLNACSEAQVGKPEHNVADTRSEWISEDFHLETNTRLVFAPDGQLAGYIEVWDTNAIPVSPWVWGRTHPDYEGQGIGTAMLTWAEDRVRQVFPRVPDDARVVMRCGALSTHESSKALLTGYGLSPIRYFWTMVIDLAEAPPEPIWPEGIRIATFAEVDDLTAVMRATEDAFKDHWGYVEQPEEHELRQWHEWVNNDPVFDASLWFLAMDGNEIAGVSLCRIKSSHDPEMGWVNALGVRRPYRRQGLALALLHHSFGELYARGKRKVGLGVDAQSLTGATRLYEKAGMYIYREYQDFEKELRAGRDLSLQTLADE
ncbi:MAG TPA: GNAT family N-acetyltransferase [Anaerolineae bacterium]|nr:GNAT family N-acetyltransferase [Anaerolineae bacterium]HIP71596.1 GNAT family N-acetyltransferase [Anaerolineae bacterium]